MHSARSMVRHYILSGCATFAVLLASVGCHLCEPRDVRADTTIKVAVAATCPSLDEEQRSDPGLDSGPAVIDVWTARCCYDAVVVVDGKMQATELCEEHEVHSDWSDIYLHCQPRDYRDGHRAALDGDSGADAAPEQIVSVTGGPRETQTPTERQCVYSKVTGKTDSDVCG